MQGDTQPDKIQAISIHAPREGSDLVQSGQMSQQQLISIHAPREGSDMSALVATIFASGFQSTLPARGATLGRFPLDDSLY